MRNKTISITVLAVLLTAQAFAGGGWTKEKGEGYFKLSEWWLVADQHYTDVGLIDPNVTTGVFNTSVYAEYGFTRRITGVAYVPFFSRTYMNNLRSNTTGELLVPGESLNSFGDTDLGFQYGIKKKGKSVISAQLLFGLPLGNAAGGSMGNLQTGDGEFNQYLKLDVGIPFNIGDTKMYTNLYGGVNNRTNGFSDELRFGAELGAGLSGGKLWLIAKSNVVESLRNGASREEVTSTSVFANNTEFVSLQAEAAYYIKPKFGVTASMAGAVSGSIILAAPSYSVGIFWDLKKS